MSLLFKIVLIEIDMYTLPIIEIDLYKVFTFVISVSGQLTTSDGNTSQESLPRTGNTGRSSKGLKK